MLGFCKSFGSVVLSAVALAACNEGGAGLTTGAAPGELQSHPPLQRAGALVGAAGARAAAGPDLPPTASAADGGAVQSRGRALGHDEDAGCEEMPHAPPSCSNADDAGSDPCFSHTAPRPIVRITASDFHTCAVLSDGRVLCWGMNPSGENNSSIAHKSDRAELVDALSGARELTAGRSHACFLTNKGDAKCYGINYYGELGDGTTNSTARPVNVLLGEHTRATAFALGEQFSCALIQDGTVQCWGGWTGGNLEPRAIPGLSGVTAVSGAGHHACALLRDQSVQCWSDYINTPAPAPLTDLQGVVQIGLGASYGSSHGCALLASGELKCWNDMVVSSVPVLHDVVNVATAERSTCALLKDRSVRCWGDNDHGQLGNGTDSGASVPSAVPGVSGVKLLAAGAMHYCAVRADDSVQCWGFGLDGELGNGARVDSNRPVNVLFPNE